MRKRILAILLALTLTVSMSFGFGALAESGTAGDKTLKLYVAGFQNLDPQIWTWGTHVDRMGIFEGLTLLNDDFTARLGNAESLTPNDDYTVWTAKLREDLKWSDGTALTANDYYYSLRRIIDPQYLSGKSTAFNTNAPILNALACQKGEVSFDEVGIALIDDYTIQFTLSTACTNFDIRLAESWGLPVPQQAIETYGDDWTTMDHIVCNGPYMPVAREEDVHLTLEPNPNYYESVALDRIEIYAGAQNQLLAYQTGDINVATVTAADIDAVLNDETLKSQLHMVDTSVVSYIGLLKGDNTVLQENQAIRQAISLSIDREVLASSINKDTTSAAYSLIFPGFASWAATLGKEVGTVDYNVEKAQQLMEEAGYPNGEGLGTMTLLMAGTPGADVLAIADMITKGTGIKVEIKNEEWAAFTADRDSFHEDGTWGIFLDAWNTSVASVAGAFSNYQFDIRVGNLDAAGLKAFADANRVVADEEAARQTATDELSTKYATLYESLLTEADPVAAEEGYKTLEAYRLEACVSIPIAFTRSALLIAPTIEGYVGNPLLLNSPPFYFKDVSND